MSPKRTFAQRVNGWLAEPPDAQFQNNKWKFWYLTLCGFQLLNATLTALVFSAGGQLQNAMGAVVLAVGGLLAWLGVAFMHYSDSADKQLAYRVSVLDSITLICVLAHFSFLAWTFGHLRTLQSAEGEYKAAAVAYNERAEKISADNARIAASAETIAKEQTRRAGLESDAAFQLRKAAELGARVPGSRSVSRSGDAPALATAPIELEKPQRPAESSAAFLSRWDSAIRLANLAELILAAATLIYIRVRSSKTNSPGPTMDFSSLLSVASRAPVPRPAFSTTHVSSKADDTDAQRKTTHVSSKNLAEGLRRLRETLKEISFYTPGQHYKADVKDDCVWIRAMTSDYGVQRTKDAAKAKLDILRDALTMDREAYRLRVERFLKQNRFEI